MQFVVLKVVKFPVIDTVTLEGDVEFGDIFNDVLVGVGFALFGGVKREFEFVPLGAVTLVVVLVTVVVFGTVELFGDVLVVLVTVVVFEGTVPFPVEVAFTDVVTFVPFGFVDVVFIACLNLVFFNC